jgi:hypothetical protein
VPVLKLYRRNPTDGRITRYHEAWVHGTKIMEHWGELGTQGESREHRRDARLGEDDNIRRVLQAALDAGYAPVDEDALQVVLVEYPIDGFGNAADLRKRHELEERLNETLGWTGLGHVDGGSTGSGTMEVSCLVVDADVARRVIAADLDDTPFAEYSRIFAEEEE